VAPRAGAWTLAPVVAKHTSWMPLYFTSSCYGMPSIYLPANALPNRKARYGRWRAKRAAT